MSKHMTYQKNSQIEPEEVADDNILAPMKNTARKVRIVGNSEVVTLPSNVKEKLSIQNGDEIEFLEQNGRIVIRKSILNSNQKERKHK
ncbi:AbrB/MazE/SpoVT family DNA-binding domain-containing protein [Staphylococcus aureus]|uniref:AbrB/MazE/SpoVT family DNA-binding domain-containing protein n=1 Tax=Staphylococcaceae TaxID=90964 RepID=UPI001CC50743|nr:AbrB/MazE/SpoVT family DNA-binding domain-containing protein [Staphylococcus aureus]MBZ5280818.1 AbrB/MazE/SpoVT family DNA-binding domain-containing protein [Staphylococcus aureus]MDG6736505.1 AbrB/MazE/SpoVT family DNA-binding domain-containing protein [Staphylococcus aureus]